MESMVNSIDKGFWKNKKVFVTGNTGFKGSWLSLWLTELGASVRGYSLPPTTSPSMYNILGLDKRITTTKGNVCDYQKLSAALSSFMPEIVIHMAAQPLVRQSYVDPLETYHTNVIGTVNILESCRQIDSVQAILNVTTDKCYQNREWAWAYREIEPMGGHDPYSSSKACSELITASYRNSFFLDNTGVSVATARAGNVIGGGDWSADRLIPDIIRAITTDQDLIIRNPNAIRPWQHVLEPLNGYMMLCEKMSSDSTTYSEAWNFGPFENDAQEVHFLVDTLIKSYNSKISWKQDTNFTPHEARYLKLDISKATSYLNWKPRWCLADAAQATASWYRAFYDSKDMYEFTLSQIKTYSD